MKPQKAPAANTKLLLLIGGCCIALGAFSILTVKVIKSIMKISEKGKALIKQHEGLRLTAYLCPAGIPTIGYGHTAGVKMGTTITQAEADRLLTEDLKKIEIGVSALLLGTHTTQHQFDALVSFAFNLGLGALTGSTLLKKVRANPKDPGIRAEFQKWVNANGVKLTGLVKRRNEEANLYFT